MFDIGFWELVMIGLVALVVIGPERLPRVARTTGMWVGRARGFLSSVKADIDRELKAEELRRVLEEQQHSSGLHEIVEETREAIDETRGALDGARDELTKETESSAAPAPQNDPAARDPSATAPSTPRHDH